MKNLTIPIKYGLAIGTALIAYFLILSLFGAHTNPIYSLLNGVLAGYGIYEGIKHYKLLKGEKFKYQKREIKSSIEKIEQIINTIK